MEVADLQRLIKIESCTLNRIDNPSREILIEIAINYPNYIRNLNVTYLDPSLPEPALSILLSYVYNRLDYDQCDDSFIINMIQSGICHASNIKDDKLAMRIATPNVAEVALACDVEYIRYMKQTYETCAMAIRSDIRALSHIRTKTPKIKALAMSLYKEAPLYFKLSPRDCEVMMAHWPDSIRYVKKAQLTVPMCLAAVLADPACIVHVPDWMLTEFLISLIG
jgi:hypothetical protein